MLLQFAMPDRAQRVRSWCDAGASAATAVAAARNRRRRRCRANWPGLAGHQGPNFVSRAWKCRSRWWSRCPFPPYPAVRRVGLLPRRVWWMKDWTVRQVEAVRRAGTFRVSRGLYLQVEPAADGEGFNKSWLHRYMRRGRARGRGLGSVKLVTLAEARDEVLADRRLLLKGVDPLEARSAERLAAQLTSASTMTFRACATAYIAAHETAWRNDKLRLFGRVASSCGM
jgi:hypothetical protein